MLLGSRQALRTTRYNAMLKRVTSGLNECDDISRRVPVTEWSSTFKPSLFPLSSKVQSSSSSAMSWRILSFAVSAACLLILVRSGGWLCAVGTPLSLATACLICKGTRACQCRVLCEATIILGQLHLSLEYDVQPFPFSTLLDFSRLRLIAVLLVIRWVSTRL